MSDMKRINSLFCSIAYPILDEAGVLAPSRLREQIEQVVSETSAPTELSAK
jgi:phosphate:Na+ symporter